VVVQNELTKKTLRWVESETARWARARQLLVTEAILERGALGHNARSNQIGTSSMSDCEMAIPQSTRLKPSGRCVATE
jgi:hypothetical protein